ncbi:MAG TPA: hypothetical protein VF242_02865 [Nitrososphaeraceae archaeon]
MRCQNITDNNRRCKRTASKIAIVKHAIDEKQQSKLMICDECFNEKMYSDQLFKDKVIQVTELNKNRNGFYSKTN